MIKNLRQQYRNALTIIGQMKRGEWEFKGEYRFKSDRTVQCFWAERNGVRIWVASGGLFCGVEDRPWELGIFGNLVWHFGAKQAKRALERKMRRQPSDMSGGEA